MTFAYDADGNRTAVTRDGVTTEYLVDKNQELAQVLVERTGADRVTYVYGAERISMNRPGSGTRFFLADGQLSTRALTRLDGTVSDTYEFDAFGVLLDSSGSTPNDFLYTGEQLDPNVGFYYLRARYYAQALGRFLTTDPESGSIFEPRSLHRYLYANADPVDNRDPSGRSVFLFNMEITAWFIAKAAIGVGVAAFGIAYAISRNLALSVTIGIVAAAAVVAYLSLVAAGVIGIAEPGVRTTWAQIIRIAESESVQNARKALSRFLDKNLLRVTRIGDRVINVLDFRCRYLDNLAQFLPTLANRPGVTQPGDPTVYTPAKLAEFVESVLNPVRAALPHCK